MATEQEWLVKIHAELVADINRPSDIIRRYGYNIRIVGMSLLELVKVIADEEHTGNTCTNEVCKCGRDARVMQYLQIIGRGLGLAEVD